jgi:hypothetical protein
MRKILTTALVASLAVSGAAFAAKPLKGQPYGGDKSTTSQGGKVSLTTNSSGKVFDFYFSYACAPSTDVTKYTRQYFYGHGALKVSKKGRFGFKGTLKTFEGGPLDPGGPYTNASVTFKGKFATRRQARGTLHATSAGCDSGNVTWTAPAE